MSNLSCIGFTFADGEEFQARMLELAAASIERVECEAGCYSIWRSRTGAEIWFHLRVFGHEDDARDIAGLTPWLEGDSEIAVEIRRRLVRPDDNAFEGAFEAWCGGDDGFPLVMDAVDFAVHAGRDLPFRCTARLTAFAARIDAYASAADLAAAGASREGAPGLDSKTFIPLGMFPGTDDRLSARFLLTGRVAQHARVANEASGGTFERLLVETLPGSIDIVADPACVAGAIVRDGYVQVTGLLLGRLLD